MTLSTLYPVRRARKFLTFDGTRCRVIGTRGDALLVQPVFYSRATNAGAFVIGRRDLTHSAQ